MFGFAKPSSCLRIVALLLALLGTAWAGRGCQEPEPAKKPAEPPASQPKPQNKMKTALQIGDISTHEGRVWISGTVLSGVIGEGDRLEAVGLATNACVIDEVRVKGSRLRATEGQECQLFLRAPDASFQRDGTKLYLGLVEPGSVTSGRQMRASLTWASLKDEPLPAGPGFAPAVRPIAADTRVELRFVDVKVPATLKKPAVVRPVGGTDEWDFVLDRPLPVIPRFGFSMDIGGQFAAMGEVIGPAASANPPR